MMKRQMAVGAFALAAATIGSAPFSRDAAATEEQPQMLSVRLLRSDAIVFATVSSLRPTADQPDLVEAQLSGVSALRSRWDLKVSPLSRIRVSGRIDTSKAPLARVGVGAAGELREGARYMMLLSGGAWSGSGPFASGGLSVLEIRKDGQVACDSGFLYGIDARGFICGQPEDFAGAPMTETELQTDLRKLADRAAAARPTLHRELTQTVRPLRLER